MYTVHVYIYIYIYIYVNLSLSTSCGAQNVIHCGVTVFIFFNHHLPPISLPTTLGTA